MIFLNSVQREEERQGFWDDSLTPVLTLDVYCVHVKGEFTSESLPILFSLAQSLEKSKPCYGYLKSPYILLINPWSGGQKIRHFDFVKCSNLI